MRQQRVPAIINRVGPCASNKRPMVAPWQFKKELESNDLLVVIWKREGNKRTEKKNTQNCKDPIQDIVDADRCCSWWEAYHAWYVPNALIWPKVQANAINAPSTVKLALRPPSGNVCGLIASVGRTFGGKLTMTSGRTGSSSMDRHMGGGLMVYFLAAAIWRCIVVIRGRSLERAGKRKRKKSVPFKSSVQDDDNNTVAHN